MVAFFLFEEPDKARHFVKKLLEILTYSCRDCLFSFDSRARRSRTSCPSRHKYLLHTKPLLQPLLRFLIDYFVVERHRLDRRIFHFEVVANSVMSGFAHFRM